MADYGTLENYQALATGIVQFAIEDYEKTLESLLRYYPKYIKSLENAPTKKHEETSDLQYKIYCKIQNLHDIEEFVRSKWVKQLTSLNGEELLNKSKEILKQKGYKVNTMGLTVSTDEKGVTVFAKEKEWSGGKFMTYSLGVSSKGKDGGWVNGYLPCRFKKDIVVENKAKIEIKKSFFVVNKSGDKSYVQLMVTDFDIVQEGEAINADEFMKIPDGISDEVPFL